METSEKHKHDMDVLIARTLRWGVSIACLIAAFGGALYLYQNGAQPMQAYTSFSYTAQHDASYTTLSGIWAGLWQPDARSWIALGVCALLLTPMMRVLLSLIDFLRTRDWLYAAITATVLAVIIINSLGG